MSGRPTSSTARSKACSRARAQRLAAGQAVHGLETLRAQGVQHGVGDGGFVFDQQDAGHAEANEPRAQHQHSRQRPSGYPMPMNYRHAFHAGNHADVLKHVVLLAICDALTAKPAPVFALDTHAGRGLYALDSNSAQRTGEAEGGIGRLLAEAPTRPADRALPARHPRLPRTSTAAPPTPARPGCWRMPCARRPHRRLRTAPGGSRATARPTSPATRAWRCTNATATPR